MKVVIDQKKFEFCAIDEFHLSEKLSQRFV